MHTADPLSESALAHCAVCSKEIPAGEEEMTVEYRCVAFPVCCASCE